MKIISKITIIFTLVTIIFLAYFSFVGIKTNKFNTQIKNKLTNTNKDFDIELDQVNLKLNPFELKLNGSRIVLISFNSIFKLLLIFSTFFIIWLLNLFVSKPTKLI